MARRSKDENQFSLFDIAPVKPVRAKKTQKSNVEFTPQKKELVFYIIGFKNGAERYHQSVEESDIDRHKEFNKQHGYDSFKVYSTFDYWEKFKTGEFTVGNYKKHANV